MDRKLQDVDCIVFEGAACLGRGPLKEVAVRAKDAFDRDSWEPILIFDARTSEPIEMDLRGSIDEVLYRLAVCPSRSMESPDVPVVRRPGRPKLGVEAKEVTLLPRHWEWLKTQPGGASATLRRLVETARRNSDDKDRRRAAQEAAYRFLSAMAGNLPNFEEATRALFAGDTARFTQWIEGWPEGIRRHAQSLANAAMRSEGDPNEGDVATSLPAQ